MTIEAMDDIEIVKQKTNIVDLISQYVPLKKAGVNFKANCPFHNEKTPSFVISPERQIFKCFGCFPPGELIKTPFGYHSIEEINKNHWVVSGRGNLRRVTEVMVHQYDGELISIYNKKLRQVVKLTADHNVFVIRGAAYTQKKYKYFSRRYKKYLKFLTENPDKYYKLIEKYFSIQQIPAGKMKNGDLVLYPINQREKDIDKINLTEYISKNPKHGKKPRRIPVVIAVGEDLLKLLGYWIAEGSSHRAYIRFSLGNQEEELAAEIIYLIKKLFGLEAKIHRRPNLNKTGLEITACHSQLANIFENLCGRGAENKHIPFVFQELPVNKQKILLEAILKGDGHLFTINHSTKPYKSITTISKILMEQLTDILLRLNLFPTVHIRQSRFDKLAVNHKQSYYIVWSEVGRQMYDLRYYQPDGSVYWLLPITKVESEKYKGPVHNFTVAYDHSYVATNFAVANCQKSGDSFSFLMEKEGLDFKDALEILAKKAGIVLQKKADEKKDLKDRLFEANLKAQEFFHYILTKHTLGKTALKYLKERGLTESTIEEFGLGYAPNSWESLTKFLLKRGFQVSEIVSTGLGVSSKSGCYDRFRGRITFPIYDSKEKLRGFSGRVLYNMEPKYINTPQTLIFDKGNLLFGLNLAKTEIRNKKEAVLVEGEMDMIMSYQAGFKNVVASKGTALTEGQIELLKKFTENLSLGFDMDLAGDSACRRGIELADKAGLNLKVVQLLGGKDAAEAVRENPALWQQAIDQAVPIYDYYLTSVAKRYNTKSPADLRKIGEELIPVWAKISNELVKDHYIQRLAAFLKVDEGIIRESVQKATAGQSSGYADLFQKTNKPDNAVSSKGRMELLEEYLIALLLHLPKGYNFVPNFPETIFLEEKWKQIYVLLVLYLDSISFKSTAFNINEFVSGLPKELVLDIDRLYLTELDSRLTDDKFWKKELDGVVAELKKALIKASLQKLSLEIKSAQEFDKMDLVENLNKRFRDLSVKLKNL